MPLLALDNVEFAHIHPHQLETKLVFRFVRRKFKIQIRHVEKSPSAKLRGVIEDEVFDAANRPRQTDLQRADLHIHPRRFPNLTFRNVLEDLILEQNERDNENDREDQESKGPAEDEFDHTLGGPLQLNILRQDFPALLLVLPDDRRKNDKKRRNSFPRPLREQAFRLRGGCFVSLVVIRNRSLLAFI